MTKKKNRFRKHKTNSNQNMYFQNVEGEHKEKATCVSDVNVGSIYMNHPQIPQRKCGVDIHESPTYPPTSMWGRYT